LKTIGCRKLKIYDVGFYYYSKFLVKSKTEYLWHFKKLNITFSLLDMLLKIEKVTSPSLGTDTLTNIINRKVQGNTCLAV